MVSSFFSKWWNLDFCVFCVCDAVMWVAAMVSWIFFQSYKFQSLNIGRFLYCDNLVGLIFSLQITKFGFLWIFCVRQKSEKKIIKCNWLAALRIIWYFDRSVPGTSLLACLPGRCQHHTSVFVFVCILVFVKLFSYHQQVAAALAAGFTCVFSIVLLYLYIYAIYWYLFLYECFYRLQQPLLLVVPVW